MSVPLSPRATSTRSIAVLAAAALLTALLALGASAPATHAAAFPVKVTTSSGSVTIKQRPKRIISLSPTATESLYAIGAGTQVIAVDDQSNYPAKAPQTSLSGLNPNIEAIAKYKPDLVIAQFDPGGLKSGMKKIKVPLLLQPAANSLGSSYQQIRELGAATGRSGKARSVVRTMRTQIARIVASVPKSSKRLKVYHELSPDYYSATSKTFTGQIYGLFGLRNIADAADTSNSGFPQLSGEFIVASNPGIIVLADSKCCKQTPAKVAKRPGWSRISAVKSKRVVAIDDDIASRWGPRVVNFTQSVATTLRQKG
jgi:iron complex transport system substrate-binding protein